MKKETRNGKMSFFFFCKSYVAFDFFFFLYLMGHPVTHNNYVFVGMVITMHCVASQIYVSYGTQVKVVRMLQGIVVGGL